MSEELEHTMPKAPEPRPGSHNHDDEVPTATTPPPAGYFTAPEPAPTFGPGPSAVPDPATPGESGSAAAKPGPPPTSAAKAVRHPVRVGTVVWGAVVLVLGTLIILSTQLNLDLNAGLTAMWLLLGAGVAMLVGGVIDVIRRKQH